MCDDQWDLLDAQVVCNQLGLGPAIAATKSSFFGLAEGDFGIDNVECFGSEDSILDCDLSSSPNCDRSEVAGVICSSRISFPTSSLNNFFLGVDIKEGNVFLDNMAVCSSTWTDENAKVACRQMGFSNGIMSPEQNVSQNISYHQKSFDCSGLEQNLLACPIVNSNCTGQQAKVMCSGKLIR